MNNKIFVMGIDGGTLDVILPLAKKGRLPHMSKLLEEGVHGDLESTIHPITPAAWSSFATGKNPGKHGIFDFSSPHPDHYGFRLNSAKDRKGESFWMFLGKLGRKVTVINVPFTYPPEKVNGVMISGFDAPGANRSMACPPEVFDELVREFGSYTPDWTFPTGKKFDLEKYRNDVASTVRQRTESSLYLLRKYPWDLFVTVFNSIDHVQHIFFGLGEEGMRVIEEGYELMDEALGAFLDEIGKEATVIIMSDHGAGPIKKFVYLDQWLEREGYLTSANKGWLKGAMKSSAKGGRRLLKRVLPVGIRGYLRGRLPGARDFITSQATSPDIDWSKTRAYSGGMYGNIYINLKNRRVGGIVEDSEYDPICRDIVSRLYDLRDPETGEPVVEKVYRKDEVYHGPCISNAPDLLIRWKEYAYYTHKGIDQRGAIFGGELKLDSSDYPHTGTHRMNGVFAARGPSLTRGERLQGMRIVDLAPSILYLMGEPIPDDMDGRIVTEMFERDFLGKAGPRYLSRDRDEKSLEGPESYTQEESAQLAERLKSLGYIE